MKRSQLKIRTTLLLAVLPLFCAALPAAGGSATWLQNAPNSNWNNASNWTAGGPPTGTMETATFGVSSQDGTLFTANTEVNGITFTPGASVYTITANLTFTLTLSGVGITNNSGTTQSFVADASGANHGTILFINNATAGSATLFVNEGSHVAGSSAGLTQFSGTSTAGSATIISNGGGGDNTTGGMTDFIDASSADSAAITSNAGLVSTAFGGKTQFFNASSAGSATITSNGFAGNGGILLHGHSGATVFYDTSTAGSATLIANGGTNSGVGGVIGFLGNSDGGTARVIKNGNGWFDISLLTTPGMEIGSIEGTGLFTLGSKNLRVGNNNLSTTVFGTIHDYGSLFGGTGGSLTKIGAGTLTLAGENGYTGGTFINSGVLQATHDRALATGNVNIGPEGTLRLQGGATNNYIYDTGRLSIVTGSTVHLDYTGNPDVIGFLLVDGVSQPAGLYGSAASGAPNQLPHFTGLGRILVTTPAARSRKMHGTGNAHITLPFTGPVGIECRAAGANASHQIIVTFGFPVTFANASITSSAGGGMVTSTSGNGTNVITINLGDVTNPQKLGITLSGVNYGAATGDVVVWIGVLLGDTSGNGSVNASDVSLTKSKSGQTVDATNFRTDVTLSNSINSSDVSLVKSKSGTALP